jgi:TatD DNase family protein
MMLALVDTHAHLDAEEFSTDYGEVLGRAGQAGVVSIVAPAVDVDSSRRLVSMAREHEGVYAAVGVHPHSAEGFSEKELSQLRELAADPKVVAIGEIGLDYEREYAPRADQQHALRAQLALARELNLPLVLHQRQAKEDLLSLLSEAGPGLRGVFHAFSGDPEWARRCLETGFYLSLAGPVTFLNAHKWQATVAGLPLGRLLLETDSPYLAPHPYRGQRNEPAWVRQVAEALAVLLGAPLEKVAGVTTRNAQELFGLPARFPSVEAGAVKAYGLR